MSNVNMSNVKKTIQINPELFRIAGSSKTRKNREKRDLTLVPVVSPNNLKNKLLTRIKEHKSKELSIKPNSTITNNHAKKNSYENEFLNAIDYLSDLSKKQKNNAEKEQYQQTLNNKTLKNHIYTNNSINNNNNNNPYVSLELPPELQETIIKSSFIPENNSSVMNINYRPDNDVPYGCLKGGVKPSYRSWIQTRKNVEYPELENVSSIRPPTPPKKNTFINTSSNNTSSITSNSLSREQRLEQIKNKLKMIQEKETLNNPKGNILKETIAFLEPVNNLGKSINEIKMNELPEFETKDSKVVIPTIFKETPEKRDVVPISKKYLKRTIKRKFTLGKSDKLHKVAVLLKDKQTRKNVINAQKELKRTDITAVRKYLRQHGIVKVGSTAPTDVLRKIFETSMLAGEITNTNKDTLLHNFMNTEK
jgi:hypothetical protein